MSSRGHSCALREGLLCSAGERPWCLGYLLIQVACVLQSWSRLVPAVCSCLVMEHRWAAQLYVSVSLRKAGLLGVILPTLCLGVHVKNSASAMPSNLPVIIFQKVHGSQVQMAWPCLEILYLHDTPAHPFPQPVHFLPKFLNPHLHW